MADPEGRSTFVFLLQLRALACVAYCGVCAVGTESMSFVIDSGGKTFVAHGFEKKELTKTKKLKVSGLNMHCMADVLQG